MGLSPGDGDQRSGHPSQRADPADEAVFVPDHGGPGPFDRVARAVARTVLRLPRYSWVRLFSGPLRHMARQAGAEYHRIRAADGIELDVARLPPKTVPPTPRLPVIHVHGWLEVKEVHLREARALNEAGHEVFLVDMRAHGRSEGRRMSFGARERHDLSAVLDTAIERGWAPGGRAITMGFSLGGAVAIQHAAIDHRVAGVVALAPFVNARQSIRSARLLWWPWGSRRWLERGFEVAADETGFTLDEASALAAMKKLQVPALLVVGERDRLLPPGRHAHALYEASRPGVCRLLDVRKAAHVDLCALYWSHIEAEVLAFCAECSRDLPVATEVGSEA